MPDVDAPGAGNVAKSFAESTLILPLAGGALEQKITMVPVVGQKSVSQRQTTVVAAITAIVRNVFRRKMEGQSPERARL